MTNRYKDRKYNQIHLRFIRKLNAFKDRFRALHSRSPDQKEIDIWLAENNYLKKLGE